MLRELAGKSAGLIALALFAAGCNLDLDTDGIPYRVNLTVDDADQRPDLDTVDMGDASPPLDMEPEGEPSLVITEILINTSIMDTDIAFGELGEFVEIKNVGDAPADPQRVTMRLNNVDKMTSGAIFIATAVTQEQLEVINGLRDIEPGEYFVFVRHSIAEIPIAESLPEGSYYDFGRYGEGVSLSNSDERLLELGYNTGESIDTHDRVRWRGSTILAANGDAANAFDYESDVSVIVRPGNDASDMNDTPDRWCLSADSFGPSIVQASPGGPGSCQ